MLSAPRVSVSLEKLKSFWEKIGVEVVEDEVGHQRAVKFYEEVGLRWSQDNWRIYQGKVYVKPEINNVVQQRLRADKEES